MNAVQRVAHSTVLEPVALYHLQQRSALTVRRVAQRHLLVAARNGLVELLKQGYEAFHEVLALGVDQLALACHLLLPQRQNVWVGLLVFVFQHGVALHQRFVIAVQRLYIGAVQLCDDHIHQSASLLAAALNQVRVGRCYEHDGYQSYMFRQSLIRFLVALKHLLRTPLHPTRNRKL